MEMPDYHNPTAVPPVEGGNPTEEADPALSFLEDLLLASPSTIQTLHLMMDVALAMREGTPELPALPPAPPDVLSPMGQFWKVWGNDPVDALGASSVHMARHSAGKPEEIAKAAFPAMPDDVRLAWISDMPADDVWTLECQKGWR